ncbi:MAG: aminotransferase [Acidobacteria bacterium]|nr:aminotransferase [Acidobacteriota bacterium]
MQIKLSETELETKLALLDQFTTEHDDDLGWVRPRGGLTSFPWLRDGSDARAFCRALAVHGVLLAPGDCFEMSEHFR